MKKVILFIVCLFVLTGCPSEQTKEVRGQFGENSIMFMWDVNGNKYIVTKGVADTFFIKPYKEPKKDAR